MVKITGITPADTFAYDGENRRIYSKESGVQQVNLYDIFGNLIAQYPAGSGLFTTDYVWANGEPRMRIDTLINPGLGPLAPGDPTESPYWYHTDHLGTPYVLTDTLKVVQWKISLDPFGETVSENTPEISDNLRFPGQLADRGSLLNYNWHRYYQPKIGRYYQVDPVVNIATSNYYVYVNSNSLKFIDRNGKQLQNVVREAGSLGTGIPCGYAMRTVATRFAANTNRIDEDPNILDGKRDAVRHCLGICLMVKRCGLNVAAAGAIGKELWDLPTEEGNIFVKAVRLVMDSKNNYEGALCSRKVFCRPVLESCFNCCLNKLTSGDLFTASWLTNLQNSWGK